MKLFCLLSSATALHYATEDYPSGLSGSHWSDFYFDTSLFDGECGGTITSDQSIFSPGFDRGAYYDFLDCTWDIQLGDDVLGFNIRASSFDVEYQSSCGFDNVKVTSPNSEYGYFCGSND